MADFTRVAVLPDGRWILIGDSTDTKPSAAPAGSEASEVDTGYRYVFEDSEWVLDERLFAVNVVRGAHIDHANGVAVVEQGQFDYVDVAAGSDTDLGTGAAGDFLHRVHIEDGCTAVAFKDGGVTVYTWTPQTGETEKVFNMRSRSGKWTLNATTAGVLAVGRFTP